ncbi:MAG: His/Gly/Thr/Pro-type tRNA ligase C-terminal domain-containing protein, partial [Prevotellaceae bacterium]|nr:His/Gly/Thr/Pro-type tRNA ligase C-terminal domain-containing protein [Prevotellaceae bacterium]
EIIGQADKIVDITIAIDKLDKIGLDNVKQELNERGLTNEQIEKIEPILTLSGTNAEKLAVMRNLLSNSETGLKGLDEIEYILSKLTDTKSIVNLDLSLARGLNYYTGAIFEVKALDVSIGSITGGGRYDNLTGIFGMPGVSGVGISFGADRIYDVLNQLNLYPKEMLTGTQVMCVNFGEAEADYCLSIISRLRSEGIRAEMYPDAVKMKKQMAYANAKQIPYVILAGETEISASKMMLKNMETGEQELISVEEAIEHLW